jgi:SAM-dependent methyltransferase
MSKGFRKIGRASGNFERYEDVRVHGYIGNTFAYTPLIVDQSPFNDRVKNAKNVLDLGCGYGRNAQYIMENTEANYVGLDPNLDMLKFFWDFNDKQYENRIELTNDIFDKKVTTKKFDIVISTFVLQHICYHPHNDVMNVDDITQNILPYTSKNTLWFLIEHDTEQTGWLDKWLVNNKFKTELRLPTSVVYKFIDHEFLILTNESVNDE